MFTAMRAGSFFKPEFIAFKLQGGFHFRVGEPPITMFIIQVITAVLHKNFNILLFMFADNRRIIIPAAYIGIASYLAEYFLEIFRVFPCSSKGTDSPT